jgi:hypothetical protein
MVTSLAINDARLACQHKARLAFKVDNLVE